jgi:hypothetical protein
MVVSFRSGRSVVTDESTVNDGDVDVLEPWWRTAGFGDPRLLHPVSKPRSAGSLTVIEGVRDTGAT